MSQSHNIISTETTAYNSVVFIHLFPYISGRNKQDGSELRSLLCIWVVSRLNLGTGTYPNRSFLFSSVLKAKCRQYPPPIKSFPVHSAQSFFHLFQHKKSLILDAAVLNNKKWSKDIFWLCLSTTSVTNNNDKSIF